MRKPSLLSMGKEGNIPVGLPILDLDFVLASAPLPIGNHQSKHWQSLVMFST